MKYDEAGFNGQLYDKWLSSQLGYFDDVGQCFVFTCFVTVVILLTCTLNKFKLLDMIVEYLLMRERTCVSTIATL